MDYYLSIFERGKKLRVSHNGKNMPMPEGTVLFASFELDGQEIMVLNGGPHFTFTEAMSLVVYCDDQAEVDHFWKRLGEGGHPGQCGWLRDKFGVSWQIVPRAIDELLQGKDAKKVDRKMQALMEMSKLDIATLKRAYEGSAAKLADEKKIGGMSILRILVRREGKETRSCAFSSPRPPIRTATPRTTPPSPRTSSGRT